MLLLDTVEAFIDDMKLIRLALSFVVTLAIAFGRGVVFISSVVGGRMAVLAFPLFVGIAAAMPVCGSAVSNKGVLSVRLLSASVLSLSGR